MAKRSKKSKEVSNNTNIVLVEGEVTGHAHRAVGLDLLFSKDVLSAPNGTTITHEEHKTIEVPPGEFVVDRVREQDHFMEEARRVRD